MADQIDAGTTAAQESGSAPTAADQQAPQTTEVEGSEPQGAIQQPTSQEQQSSSQITEQGSAPAEGEEHKKLRNRAQTAEQESAYWRGVAEGRSKPEAQPVQSTPQPQSPQFIPLEEFAGSYEDWVVAKAKFEINAENDQRRVQAEVANLDRSWSENCKRIPDIQDVINQAAQLPIRNMMVINAVKRSDLGPEILNYLVKNPTEAQRIAGMSPELAIMEIGSLRDKAKAAANAVPQTRKVTQAPPPFNPVRPNGAMTETDLADLPMDQYAAKRSENLYVRTSGGRLLKK